MANELRHKDIGEELTKEEFEDVTLHQLDSQAAGDLIKATSATQLSRLPIGANDKVLTVVSGVPAWADAPAATLAEDTSGQNTGAPQNAGPQSAAHSETINAGADWDPISVTPTFNANSMAVGYVSFIGKGGSNASKMQIYMGGVQAAESAYLNGGFNILIGFKALSGAQVILCRIHNYSGAGITLWAGSCAYASSPNTFGVAAGSIKVA